LLNWLTASDVRFRGALALGGLGVGIYVAAAVLEPPGADLPRHVLLFLVSFAFYLGAVWLLLWGRGQSKNPAFRGVLAAALVWAVLLRLALLTTAPSLSDDLFRYVWDGRVIAAGIDPYRFAPDAPELAPLRDSLWLGVNAKSMPTPYPPLAEGLFALVYRLSPDNLAAMKVAAVLFDLGVIALVLLMLAWLRMDVFRVLIYAWNPLVLVQFAHSGHFDAAMVLPLLGAIFLLSVGRRVASGVLLGVSALVKVVPAMLGPMFLPLWGISGSIAAGAAVIAGVLPFAGSPALMGVLSEASDARFNDSAGYILTRLIGLITDEPDAAARSVAGAILVLASLLAAAFLWKRGAEWQLLLRGVYCLLGLFILLNAVVEPWYLTWIVPFLCFTLPAARGRLSWASPSWGWLLLSGLIMLTDLTYVQGIGNGAWVWIRAAEYVPLYALLALWLWRQRARLAFLRSGSPTVGEMPTGDI
jgi:alpha-1,6-mannosyltransferase